MSSLFIASLNSGSNGNCYYVGNSRNAVLIDAGISCRDTGRRLARLGLSADNIRALFITHEHTDHCRGAEILSWKHRIPVYITPVTRQAGRLRFDPALIRTFTPDSPVQLGDLAVTPFAKLHDGADPHSFTVSCDHVTVGVMTDIGTACDKVVNHFSRCNAAFLEANYDETMLATGRYPIYLKRRIAGDRGHLSNTQSLDLFLNHRAPFLELLVLSHLSAQNNRPEIVRDLFAPHANGTRIEIASRYEESEVFEVTGRLMGHKLPAGKTIV
jgi:phosphoribosyl 1,2-cyclic phosphodiesterase